ncbi:Phosphomannomutase [Erysiphe necator]|uniref:Phosphomannomutase n=1 Tax=Uncinula necator TaxID=52586 RepID=A0A0B1PHQ1_UNCNE|nr:Phosphomannomutase [Erysiphe necator]KHJ36064.1 putative sec53 phosphomannomutase [Erysiphe necator]
MNTSYPPLQTRQISNTIVLFDVDGTLTPARRRATPEMLQLLAELRKKVAIGYVGGSNFDKQQEQLGTSGVSITTLFDFCFAENGLVAYKLGDPLPSNSFIKWIGEARYKELVNFILHYVADLDIPVKRGTFVEFRNGMVNVSPVGRNASTEERNEYEKYDLEHKIREKFISAIQNKFADIGLTYSIGGQISFDIFPTGWDKTYCLRHLENEASKSEGIQYKTIHFFGDKTMKGGNDYEIYNDPRVIGHAVNSPEETYNEIKKLFDIRFE